MRFINAAVSLATSGVVDVDGTANSAGVATTVARADHRHDIGPMVDNINMAEFTVNSMLWDGRWKADVLKYGG